MNEQTHKKKWKKERAAAENKLCIWIEFLIESLFPSSNESKALTHNENEVIDVGCRINMRHSKNFARTRSHLKLYSAHYKTVYNCAWYQFLNSTINVTMSLMCRVFF